LASADFWCFWYLKDIPEGSSFETAEKLQEKAADILMLIPVSTFRAVFDEWKVDCCNPLKQVDVIFKNVPSQRYTDITKRR
jgi:hypothetical protein